MHCFAITILPEKVFDKKIHFNFLKKLEDWHWKFLVHSSFQKSPILRLQSSALKLVLKNCNVPLSWSLHSLSAITADFNLQISRLSNDCTRISRLHVASTPTLIASIVFSQMDKEVWGHYVLIIWKLSTLSAFIVLIDNKSHLITKTCMLTNPFRLLN